MKKNILLVTILISFIFFLCACGSSKKTSKPKKVEEPKDTVTLEKIKYKLDQDDEGYNLKYKVASNFRKSTLINAINYYSENIDDTPYFVIRLFYYKNKDIDYAINDSTESYDKKWEETINGLDYTAVHFINFTNADVNIYYHKHGNDTYAFVFTSHLDLTRLKNIFLENVVYP